MKLIARLLFLTTITSIIGLSTKEAKAQDPRYTQYYSAPLRMNPAMIGVFEGNWRLGMNYRTQWGSVMDKSYNSYALTADARFPVLSDDFFGVGFSAMSDLSGQGRYNVTDVNLGVSYMKKITQNRRFSLRSMQSFLVAGAQVGFGQRSTKWMNHTFGTQYVEETNDYDQGINSGESLQRRESKIYPDVNLGLLWYTTFSKRNSVYLGGGLFHINRPEISLYNRVVSQDSLSAGTTAALERLYTRWSVHAGGEILLGGRGGAISLLPGFVGQFQGPSMEMNMGIGIKYQQPKYDDFALRISIWSRLANQLESNIQADAIMLVVGLDYLGFRFGVSYDLNVSALQAVSQGRGSLEFSLGYIFNQSVRRQMGCPTF